MARASKGRLVNLTELAKLFGVSVNGAKQWIGRGCPVVEQGGQGREWRFDTAAVATWRERRAVEAAVRDTSTLDLEEARRRKTAAEAALAELELERQRGEVVAIEDVAEMIGAQLDRVRTRLLAVPTKVAPLVMVETDQQACHDIVEAAQTEALNELVGWASEGAAAGEAESGDPDADSPPAEAAA